MLHSKYLVDLQNVYTLLSKYKACNLTPFINFVFLSATQELEWMQTFFFLHIKITHRNFLKYVYSTASRAALTNGTASAECWCLTTRTLIFHNGLFSLPVCCKSAADLSLLTANTVGPSFLFDAITRGLNSIADILANVAEFCILILTMLNLAPFGKTNSLWNEVAPPHKHTLLHVYEILFFYFS